jgi:hypothetical protein
VSAPKKRTKSMNLGNSGGVRGSGTGVKRQGDGNCCETETDKEIYLKLFDTELRGEKVKKVVKVIMMRGLSEVYLVLGDSQLGLSFPLLQRWRPAPCLLYVRHPVIPRYSRRDVPAWQLCVQGMQLQSCHEGSTLDDTMNN